MKIKSIAAASGAALIGSLMLAPPASARDVTVIDGPTEPEACTIDVTHTVYAEQEYVIVDEGSAERWDVLGDFSESSGDGSASYSAGPDGVQIATADTGHRKVAGYRSVTIPLAEAWDFTLNWTGTSPGPGGNLTVDLDNNGVLDGNLVIESIYGGNWWLSGNWEHGGTWSPRPGAPSVPGGGGYVNQGFFSDWINAFPDAMVYRVGFSLGSGITGSGTVHNIVAGGESWTFTQYVEAVPPTYDWVATGDTQIMPPADTDTVRWVATEETEVVVEEGLCYEQVVATDWALDFGGNCDQPVDIFTRTLTGERWMEREGQEPTLLGSWDEGIEEKQTYWTEEYWNVTCGLPIDFGPQEPVWVDECGTENDGWLPPEPRNDSDVWLYTSVNTNGEVEGDEGYVQAFLPEGYYIAGDGPMSGTRYWYPVWELSDQEFTDEACPVVVPKPADPVTPVVVTPASSGGLAETGGYTMPIWLPLGAGFLILAGGLTWFVTRRHPAEVEETHES